MKINVTVPAEISDEELGQRLRQALRLAGEPIEVRPSGATFGQKCPGGRLFEQAAKDINGRRDGYSQADRLQHAMELIEDLSTLTAENIRHAIELIQSVEREVLPMGIKAIQCRFEGSALRHMGGAPSESGDVRVEEADRPETKEEEDRVLLEGFRGALERISHILKMPGSPDLISDVPAAVERHVESRRNACIAS